MAEKGKSNRQPQWDIYEAVILLEGYLAVLKEEQPRLRIIKRISVDLRQMAHYRDLEIDNIYRNENGISYQMKSMESAYKGHTIFVPATKLFTETVTLYNADREKYNSILKEAREMIEIQNNNSGSTNTLDAITPLKKSGNIERLFYRYLHDTLKLSDRTCASYISSTKGAERYAADHRYNSYCLFSDDKEVIFATAVELYSDSDFIKHNQDQHNRYSAAINKLLAFIGKPIPDKTYGNSNTIESEISYYANENIIRVLREYYQYGFRYDSIRELMRFRQFADSLGISIPDDDQTLKKAIVASGTVIDDKVFFKSNDLPNELQNIVSDIFSSGIKVIYYEMLFERKSEWMISHVIVSDEMLKDYLQKYIKGCSFSKKFMIKGQKQTEKIAVTNELKRVWDDVQIKSVADLSKQLPYIPQSNIARVISGNDQFVIAMESKYLWIDRLHITDDDAKRILNYVKDACETNGFASLSDIPLGDILEVNYDVPYLTIINAIYKIVLSEHFHLNGRILTNGKTALDVITLLKSYVRDKDECTFNDVSDKVFELTGTINRSYAFQALYDEMIRVDVNRFVADKFVSFNVDEIDTLLSYIITDHFRAIRDVTTFAMFPLCGQNWNLYLLESFCYKYSKKYSIHVIHFNDKNSGIIVEKDYNKNYNELLAIALARTDIELNERSAGQYLFENGYLAKSKYSVLGEIIERAKILREER